MGLCSIEGQWVPLYARGLTALSADSKVRPMTHDFMKMALETLGYRVSPTSCCLALHSIVGSSTRVSLRGFGGHTVVQALRAR